MRTFFFVISAVGFCLQTSESFARQAELFHFPGAANEFQVNTVHTQQMPIMQQMENAFRASDDDAGRFVPESFGSGRTCEDYSYTPAYWLSAETERRRAVYFPFMVAIACDYGLPARLLDAVIAQESGYNSRAMSSAGAMGMMQIMPSTARSLGLTLPWDPIANMRAGARYLRDQKDRFGRMDLALAAYNAGPERKALSSGFIPAIPETLGYVRVITNNWARLAAYTPIDMRTAARATAAAIAIRTAGYREVDLSVYQEINASNPI